MKILIAGDFCPRNRTEFLINERCFSTVVGEAASVIKDVDYSIVNFETCVATAKDAPIAKYGPNLKTTVKAVECVKWAGFDCVTLANNHTYDYGDGALVNTINYLKNNGLDLVGGGKNLEQASATLYKTIAGKKIAFINCCEHEFSIATDTQAGANPLNPVQQWYAITEARKGADYVIVIVHGGHEHYQLPSPRMQETYRFFVDAGADAVINHHQHCYSGYEVYQGKPIFYGLGNFSFDKCKEVGLKSSLKKILKIKTPFSQSKWYEGYMVVLNFENHGIIDFKLIPYTQCNEVPSILLNKIENFNTKIEGLNSVIADTELLKQHFSKYVKQQNRNKIFEPLTNCIISRMQKLHLLPSFLSNKKRLLLYNLINCESHRDLIINDLKNE